MGGDKCLGNFGNRPWNYTVSQKATATIHSSCYMHSPYVFSLLKECVALSDQLEGNGRFHCVFLATHPDSHFCGYNENSLLISSDGESVTYKVICDR